MKMIAFYEAHESDIMCLEYSDPQSCKFVHMASLQAFLILFQSLSSSHTLLLVICWFYWSELKISPKKEKKVSQHCFSALLVSIRKSGSGGSFVRSSE